MPIDHEIINKDMVIITAFGVVTGPELSDHVFTLVNLHGISLNTGYKQIFDAMKVERIDFNEEDMKHLLSLSSFKLLHHPRPNPNSIKPTIHISDFTRNS